MSYKLMRLAGELDLERLVADVGRPGKRSKRVDVIPKEFRGLRLTLLAICFYANETDPVRRDLCWVGEGELTVRAGCGPLQVWRDLRALGKLDVIRQIERGRNGVNRTVWVNRKLLEQYRDPAFTDPETDDPDDGKPFTHETEAFHPRNRSLSPTKPRSGSPGTPGGSQDQDFTHETLPEIDEEALHEEALRQARADPNVRDPEAYTRRMLWDAATRSRLTHELRKTLEQPRRSDSTGDLESITDLLEPFTEPGEDP